MYKHSIFEFAAQKFDSNLKHNLLRDKAICLCLYRGAFTPVEQLVLLRMAFLATVTEEGGTTCVFRANAQKSINSKRTEGSQVISLEEMFHDNVSIQPEEKAGSAAKGSNTSHHQTQVTSTQLVFQFMRKLDGLDLIHEALDSVNQAKPFAHPGSFKKQNYEY